MTFSSGPDNPPTLQITQTNLRISGVKIVFTGASAPATNARVVFDRAQEVPFSTPFGQCVFQDIIFEPGTVVLGFAGHQVQLMRRILTLDGTEYSWTNRLISLPAK